MASGSRVDAYPARYSSFLKALQAAVASDDKDRVASMIALPLYGVSKPEFLSKYDTYFTPCVKERLRCTTIDNTAEDYFGTWLANDEILAEVTGDTFQIIGFPGEGPCTVPKRKLEVAN